MHKVTRFRMCGSNKLYICYGSLAISLFNFDDVMA